MHPSWRATLMGWLLIGAAMADHAAITNGRDMVDAGGMAHRQPPIQIPEGVPLPRLSLRVHRDDTAGANLHLTLQHYALTSPEYTERPGRLNGHAHLYVNGRKIQRLYGPDVHLPSSLFNPGVNVIVVSLNAHNHAVWQRGDVPIMASVFVDIDREQPVLHRFSTDITNH